MRYTQNFNLKKPDGSDTVDVNDFNENADIIDEEIAKKATHLQDGRMSKEDKSKLDGIEDNANNYVHPASHPPSIIEQDAENRFFTDTERTKLSGIESGAQVNEVTGEEFNTLEQEFDAHQADEAIHVTPQEKNYWNNKLDEIKVDGETVYINDDGELTTLNPNWDDQTNAPGPKILIGGTMDAGFFGEVPASQLMNGADLCSAIGLTEGNLQHSDEPFLKFAYNGKILFVNKKPIRNLVSWDAIASAGAVYGDGSSQGNAQVTIDGLTYKVRLMKGAREDPANWDLDDRSAIGSEWNDLMYPIHVNANTGDWNYSQYVGDNVPDWGVGYTDEDLLTHNNFGDGSYSWTQETRSNATSSRVCRGSSGASYMGSGTSSSSTSSRGARFVLELL